MSGLRTTVGVLALAGLGTAQSPTLVLTDITAAAGLDWVQIENNTMMGAGTAFLDFDGDGWLDILLVGGDSIPGLYHNDGSGTHFTRVAPSPFAGPTAGESMCVTIGDVDNDGDPDVYLGRFGRNSLYRNDGSGHFTDITTPALEGGLFAFTTTAAFADFDGDGNLDLYVGNYITPGGPAPHHTPTPNLLLRGGGDGTFTDVTDPVVAGAGTALATTWSDCDSDGDADLFCANDFGAYVEPNRLYRNDGPHGGAWTFTERSAQLGTDLRIYCMGIAVGDIDRDGDLDYYFTNLGRNVLLRNDGNRFQDITTAAGTELTFDPDTNPPLFATSWGCGLHDFDHDGWLDLYVSNGHIPADPALANGLRTRNTLFHHDGAALTWTTVPLRLDDGIGRGVAFGDVDNDGDVDVLQGNVAGGPVLLRNDSQRQGHWFAAQLSGRISNRDALGARVDLELDDFVARREVRRNDSFESSSDPRLHFGLGSTATIRRAAITWPSGITQDLHDVAADQQRDLTEPFVTLDEGQVRSFDLRVGRLIWIRAQLVNHTATGVDVAVQPQIRAGYRTTPQWGAPGTTLWSGSWRHARVPGNGRRTVHEVMWVPDRLGIPRRPNLDFVWTCLDRALAVDETKLGLD